MTEIIFREEVYKIVGVCMSVYNMLGYGFLEIIYKDAMEIEFSDKEMEFQREKEFLVFYRGTKLNRAFFADFYLFDTIIVEVKANADGIPDEAVAQTINYLKASGNRLGVIVNFGKSKLEYKRIIF